MGGAQERRKRQRQDDNDEVFHKPRRLHDQKPRFHAPTRQAKNGNMPKRKDTTKTTPLAMREEEPDFPRGDLSVYSHEGNEGAEIEHEENKMAKKKSRKLDSTEDGEIDRLFRNVLNANIPKSVQMLRYKSLSVGMKIWGIIADISGKDITISLPGGLRGFVQADQASDLLADTSKSMDNGMMGKGEEEVPSLKGIFSVGDLVASTVIKLDRCKGKGDKKPSKRIELSLKLRTLQKVLTIDTMHEGSVLQAYVVSVEDHGYLLSFGVPAISGFLLHRDCTDGVSILKLRRGQIVQVVVSTVDKKRGMVMVKADAKLVASAMVKELEGFTLEALNPGTLVSARVRAVLKNGLLLSFLTYFTGTVDIFHLEDSLPNSDWRSLYSENQQLKARILFVDISSKSIGLTLNTHLVRNLPPVVDVVVGEVITDMVVRRVDPTIGLLLEMPSKSTSTAGFAHISNVSDQHIEKLEKKFKEGKNVQGRIIGMRQMDGLALVTLKNSKVKQSLLCYEDVKAGMKVQGEVVGIESFGAFVRIADGLKAMCPLQHMSEFERAKPSSKFKIGANLKFKVLTCDLSSKKITLTHKKTMILSSLTPITSYDDAMEGITTHGWICGIEDYGCFVCFYNDVKGLAHRTELGLDPGVKPASAFQIGLVVKCRVLRADPIAKRISLSFIISSNRSLGSNQSDLGSETSASVGSVVSGIIVHMTEKTVVLDIPLSQGFTKGVLFVEHLADNSGHAEVLKTILYPGYKFQRLLVLEKGEQKLIVSAKYSLLKSASLLPHEMSQLHPQSVVHGYIASITKAGCFVRFLGGLTGLATVSQLSDSFVHDPTLHFSFGQSVRAQVLEINDVSGRFTLSLKQSNCFSIDASLIEGFFLEEEMIAECQQTKESSDTLLDWVGKFPIGGYIDGEVQDIKDYGVIVKISELDDVVGFATLHQMDGKVKVGQHVKARILDVVKTDGIVDLTFRSDLLQSASTVGSLKKKKSLKRGHASLSLHQQVRATVQLVKDEYLVLSLPDHGNVIAFASTRDYNVRTLDPHQHYTVGQSLEATVETLPESLIAGRMLLLLKSFSEPGSGVSSKRARNEYGSLVEGEVVKIQPLEMHLKIGKNLFGQIHITEIRDGFEEGNPLNSFTVGQTVTAKVLSKPKTSTQARRPNHLRLTLRPSEMSGSKEDTEGLPTLSTLTVGQIVTGYVEEVTEEWAWLLLSPHVRGRLHILDSSNDPSFLKSFKENFQIGQALSCCVVKINKDKGMVDLSLRILQNGKSSESGKEEQLSADKFKIKPGDIVGGRVFKVFPGAGGLSVEVGLNLSGRVHITHLQDHWTDNPSQNFKEGQFVRCYVLDVNEATTQIDLSLRSSLGGDNGLSLVHEVGKLELDLIEKIEDIVPNAEVQGYVKSISKKGCFVVLSRHVDARILFSNLSDTFVQDPIEMFPAGKLVKGRILSVEPLSGRVEMTLKSSLSDEGQELQINELHVGDLVSGAIRRIEHFGLFILIDHSKIVGMCHISEASDDYIEVLGNVFSVGDRVKAKILKIDENKRVYLGMKEAYLKDLSKVQALEEERDGNVSNSEDDEPSLTTSNSKGKGDSASSEEEDDDTNGFTPVVMEDEMVAMEVPPLDVLLEEEEEELGEGGVQSKQEEAVECEDKSKLDKKAKKRQKEQREAEIRAAEQKRLEGNEAPESMDDFEKLAHESPNSSFIWIKYMAYMLSLADVKGARKIAERALQSISFREEGEKLNVWVAYLNLENVYGDPPKEAVLELFQRALQYCDPKKLHLALLGIYERSELHDLADQLLKTMDRKFKTSAKVWLRHIQYLLRRGMADASHKCLDRALLSLPSRKHIKVISQAGILQFKIGSVERARVMFEGILRNYPKRIDLWNVYLDQEIRIGDSAVIRSIFERVICLDLPPKKMKSLFKKYLDYEKSQGDKDRIESVKEKAMEFVEMKLG